MRVVSAASALLIGLACVASAETPVPSPLTWQEAVTRLAQERERAETSAALLKTFAAKKPAALARGEMLYSDAKADFDGFIEGLIVSLADTTSPADSTRLRSELDAAVTKRLALSRYVEPLVPKQSGSRPFALDLLKDTAGDILKAIMEGGVEIWKEYRHGDELRRQSISTRLEAQKWLRFEQVKAAP